MMGMAGFGHAALEYKFVDVKSDRKEFEKAITQQGKDGWEFCGSERFGSPGSDFVLVFKRSHGGMAFGGMMGGGGMGGGMPGMPAMGGFGGGNFGGVENVSVNILLHNIASADVAAAIKKAFPKAVEVVADARTNRLMVVADPATLKDITRTIEKLDAKPGDKPKPAGPGAMGLPMGPMGGSTPGFGFTNNAAGSGGGFNAKPTGEIKILSLKHATANEITPVLIQVFPTANITQDPRTNQLIIRADPETFLAVSKLLQELDVAVPPKK
jgi:hypothetical protein